MSEADALSRVVVGVRIANLAVERILSGHAVDEPSLYNIIRESAIDVLAEIDGSEDE